MHHLPKTVNFETRYCHKGFTLVELSVVIIIFGISLMFLTPALVEKFSLSDSVADDFNKIISKSLEKSQKTGKPVFIKGAKGTNTLKSGTDMLNIDKISFFSVVYINGNTQPGGDFYIGVYPEGFIDSFEIQADNGIKITSKLNSMKVKVEYKN